MLLRNFLPGWLALLSVLPAFAADVSGIWSGTLTDNNGDPRDLSFRFTQKGETLTGKMYGDNESLPVASPQIAGNRLSFRVTTELNGQITTFLYTGILEGDKIELSRVRMDASQAPPAKPPTPQTLVLRRLT